jgi:hypothetical protein
LVASERSERVTSFIFCRAGWYFSVSIIWPLCFLKQNGIGKQNRWILLPTLMFVIKKQWISPLKEKFNNLNIYINLYK